MPDEEISAVRTAIVEVLSEAPGQRLLGAVLGNKFRTKMGRTIKDYGYRTLSDFVRENMAAEVTEIASGSNATFQLAEGMAASANPASKRPAKDAILPNADFLRIWKSPRSPYKLAIRKSDGEMRAILMKDQPNDDEIAVESPSSEEQKAIGSSFLEGHIPEEQRESFRSKLNEPNILWWKEWDTLFSEHLLPGAKAKWLKFRENRLLDLLDGALIEGGLAKEVLQYTRATILRPRNAGRAHRPADSTPVVALAGGYVPAPERTFRHTVFAALGQLSDDELRRVWLPVGVVYDILRRDR